MKSFGNIALILSLIFIISSCFTSKDDINKAKQNIGIIEKVKEDIDSGKELNTEIKEDNINEEKNKLEVRDIEVKDTEIKKEKKEIEILYGSDDQLLKFNDLIGENIFDGEIEIAGKTLGEIDKIIVTFTNTSSNFPVDKYTLKQFKKGDKDFLYRAFSRYETLDFGKNTYVFEAYYGDKISRAQVIINVVEEKEESLEEKISKVYEDFNLNDLPVSATFGTPVDLGGGKISYSDLSGLEIKNEINSDLTCETITSTLADKIPTWFFWNTCRPITDKEGISFFVIRLNGDNYIYEKHYYLSYQGIYGVQELKTGTGVDSTNIGDKNTEFKLINDDFSILKITDDLFKQILK